MIYIKSERELDIMRRAGRINADLLELLGQSVRPGITTLELDKIAYDYIKKHNAVPSFLNYRGFPNSICASINEEVVHGIPNKRALREGDIISFDVGVCLEGYHADAARTVGVGQISDAAARLVKKTEQSFFKGIAAVKAGVRLGDLSNTIQTYVEKNGYSVVRKLVGHGIGSALHELPDVPNFGQAGRGVRLLAGMTLAVEPMVNEGTYEVKTMPNGWTEVTADGKLSAHYENTIIITKDGVEMTTKL